MKEEIKALTAFRGIAAFIVLVYHARALNDFQFAPDEYTRFFARGYLWVDFFFVLSGFIISHVYGSTFDGTFRRADYLNFLRRRLRRIYPLHLATLLLFVPLLVPEILSGRAEDTPLAYATTFVHNLLLIHSWGYHPGHAWNGPSWSISAEWAAYLLFPVFFFFVYRLRPALAGAFVALALLCLGGVMLVRNAQNLDIYARYLGTLRCFAGFCLGILVWRIYDELRGRGGEPAIGRDPVCLIAIVLVAALLHVPTYDIWLLPAFALLILATALNRGATARILGAPPLYGLGLISYSLYMTHWFVIDVGLRVRDGLTGGGEPGAALGYGSMVAVLAATVLFSVVTYRWIEQPFRWGRPWRPPRSATAS